jgi:hypothetical protein
VYASHVSARVMRTLHQLFSNVACVQSSFLKPSPTSFLCSTLGVVDYPNKHECSPTICHGMGCGAGTRGTRASHVGNTIVAMWAVGVVMAVSPVDVVLANAVWWSKRGGIGIDGVSGGVFDQGGECASILGGRTGLGRRQRGRNSQTCNKKCRGWC